MINTRLAILLFLVMWIISAFIANIAQQIDFDIYQTAQSKLDTVSEKSKYGNLSVLDDSADQLMWFIQISDLHLSIFRDPDRINDLHDFGCRTLDVVRPAAVVASGDLTDAKHRDNMGSGQYEKEWEAYNHTLSKCRVREKTIWLDIRGNHDNFDVPGWKSKLNYFRTYSVQGSKQSPSYMHIIEKGGQKFAFLALDACLDLGPRRPFNFIGMLTRDNVKVVQDLLRAAKDRAVDHIIWFGHYPTSCIVSLSDDPVRKLIGDEESSKVYLCGHLHTMGGLITKMYTLQRPGYLELELGDWKDNRIFRVAAFDHGLFNFVDIRHGAWPIILITNPKNAMYALPKREPLHQMQTSTHIRLLAFSVSPIVSVQVKIDDGNWRECSYVEGPLYAVPWSPTDYLEGVHTIYARVKDNMDRVGVVDQPFSIDATKVNFNLLAKLVLMLDASTIFQCFFGLMLVISTLPLITLRLIHNRVIAGKMRKPRFKKNFFSDCVRKLWVLSTVDQLFYPLVVYDIYLCFGPWAVGELMEGYLGAVFAWGLLVNGVFIPGSFTYIYGFMQLFLCQFPLTLFLANQADKKLQQHHMGKRLNVSKITLFLENIPFIMIWALNMHFAYFFGLAYGWLAFFLGPLRTWSIVLNAYLWYKSTVLPPHCTCEAAAIWTEH